MKNRALFLAFLCVAGLLLANRYSQHILVRLINPSINVAGVKLMMAEEQVVHLLGPEQERIPGFGGYWLSYPNPGIGLTFLSDRDTDFFQKVSEIKVSDPAHQILGVRVGDNAVKALSTVRSHGFTKEKEGYPGLWKANMYVRIESDDSGAVRSISLGVRDKVASDRIY